MAKYTMVSRDNYDKTVTQLSGQIAKVTSRTDQMYNKADSENFETKTVAINSSGKCVFYGSNTNQYRSIIFPLLPTPQGGYGVKFSVENNNVTSVKLAIFSSKPTNDGNEYIATQVSTCAIVNGVCTGLVPYSSNNNYLVIAFTFAQGIDYDNAINNIKNSLYVFLSDKSVRNDVDFDSIVYTEYYQLAIPENIISEIRNKVDKDGTKGLSENDFTDYYKESIDSIVGTKEVIIKTGDTGITKESWCSTTNGSVLKTDSTKVYDVSDFIPVQNGDSFYACYARSVVMFDSSKVFISGFDLSTVSGYVGNYATNKFTINNNSVAYIRVNFHNSNYTSNITGGLYALCRTDSDYYKIVNFGDSIFGLNPKPYDVSTYIQKKTGQKTANCGFGGTRAGIHGDANIQKFSLFSLADSIASGSFSLQDGADFTASATKTYYKYNLNTLKSVDFSKVKAITIAYGTNDWNANLPIDNENNSKDTSTYKGALRYSIEKIQTAYPNLTIVLCSPLYRIIDGVDSNTNTNNIGLKLTAYVEACREVAEEYQLPFIDNYHGLGINKMNINIFMRDGTHLTFDKGVEKVGNAIGYVLNGI